MSILIRLNYHIHSEYITTNMNTVHFMVLCCVGENSYSLWLFNYDLVRLDQWQSAKQEENG